MNRVFMIDGVPVPSVIYERRKLFGEHAAAKFTIADIPSQKARDYPKKNKRSD